MARTKEDMIKANMALGLTREEAEQMYLDDMEIDKDNAKLDEATKAVLKQQLKVEKDPTKTRKKRTVERKVDEDKKFILDTLIPTLTEIAEITTVKTETEIKFTFNDKDYTLKLTAHRKPKAD